LIDFQPETLEKLVIGEKVIVKAFGVGLKLLEYPEITVMNMDPSFFELLAPLQTLINWRFPLRI
jgi:hypothetical protein